MKKYIRNDHFFFGATTIGEKGQMVIPIEARKVMNIKKGEKLLVFGMGDDVLAFTKLASIKKFASHLADRLHMVQGAIKKTKVLK